MVKNLEIVELTKKILEEEEEWYKYQLQRIKNEMGFYESDEFKFYKENKTKLIFAHITERISTFLYWFKTHMNNFKDPGIFISYEKFKEKYTEEEFYKLSMVGEYKLGVGNNLRFCDRENKNFRLIMQQIFPTGKETELINYLNLLSRWDENFAEIKDTIIIKIFDELFGKGNYLYFTNQETEKVRKELSSNPNLTIQEWVELNAKEVWGCHYHSGAYYTPQGYQYEKYINNPEYFEYDYEVWKANLQRNLKSDKEKSR